MVSNHDDTDELTLRFGLNEGTDWLRSMQSGNKYAVSQSRPQGGTGSQSRSLAGLARIGEVRISDDPGSATSHWTAHTMSRFAVRGGQPPVNPPTKVSVTGMGQWNGCFLSKLGSMGQVGVCVSGGEHV